MDYSPWGRKESHMTERLSLSLSDGPAFNLTHTSRNLLEHSQVETGGYHHRAFPFPCTRAPVSPRREMNSVLSRHLCGCSLGGLVDSLTPEARGDCLPGPMGLSVFHPEHNQSSKRRKE